MSGNKKLLRFIMQTSKVSASFKLGITMDSLNCFFTAFSIPRQELACIHQATKESNKILGEFAIESGVC
jgi:hypothetical protein